MCLNPAATTPSVSVGPQPVFFLDAARARDPGNFKLGTFRAEKICRIMMLMYDANDIPSQVSIECPRTSLLRYPVTSFPSDSPFKFIECETRSFKFRFNTFHGMTCAPCRCLTVRLRNSLFKFFTKLRKYYRLGVVKVIALSVTRA